MVALRSEYRWLESSGIDLVREARPYLSAAVENAPGSPPRLRRNHANLPASPPGCRYLTAGLSGPIRDRAEGNDGRSDSLLLFGVRERGMATPVHVEDGPLEHSPLQARSSATAGVSFARWHGRGGEREGVRLQSGDSPPADSGLVARTAALLPHGDDDRTLGEIRLRGRGDLRSRTHAARSSRDPDHSGRICGAIRVPETGRAVRGAHTSPPVRVP